LATYSIVKVFLLHLHATENASDGGYLPTFFYQIMLSEGKAPQSVATYRLRNRHKNNIGILPHKDNVKAKWMFKT